MLRGEVEAARAWGVPHSVLMGRVVRDGQAMFTAMDTALAVALSEVEGYECGGCGQDRRESTTAGADFAYEATPIRCHACAARDRAAENFAASDGSPAGLLWSVAKRQPKEAAGD